LELPSNVHEDKYQNCISSRALSPNYLAARVPPTRAKGAPDKNIGKSISLYINIAFILVREGRDQQIQTQRIKIRNFEKIYRRSVSFFSPFIFVSNLFISIFWLRKYKYLCSFSIMLLFVLHLHPFVAKQMEVRP